MDNSHPPNIGNQNSSHASANGFSMGQPSNYMSYAFGGSYDENQYSQYAPGDYNINSQVSHSAGGERQQALPSSAQIGPAKLPPKTFTDTGGGKAPDTQSAIRPTSSRDWRAGASFAEQFNGNQPPNQPPHFQPAPKDSHRPAAFEVIGNPEQPPARSVPNNPIKASYYSCPACGELAVRVSDNANRDASCGNGHRWQLAARQ